MRTARQRSARGVEPVRDEVLPRVVAGIFAVWTAGRGELRRRAGRAPTSSSTASRPAGFAAYTRTVGQVFSPDVSLIFVLKTLFLSLAVGADPDGVGRCDGPWRAGSRRPARELQGLVRMFLVILLIEVALADRQLLLST